MGHDCCEVGHPVESSNSWAEAKVSLTQAEGMGIHGTVRYTL